MRVKGLASVCAEACTERAHARVHTHTHTHTHTDPSALHESSLAASAAHLCLGT